MFNEFNDLNGFSSGFDTFGAMFTIVFVLIIGIFLFGIFSNVRQWNKNNHSPRLIVDATVVSKRMNVTHHHHGDDHMHSTSSTTYYVTFQVESGDRIELHVDGYEYGMIVEGDHGKLTFQGTRYLGFERKY